jgi:hypothetical protein
MLSLLKLIVFLLIIKEGINGFNLNNYLVLLLGVRLRNIGTSKILLRPNRQVTNRNLKFYPLWP